MARMMVYLDDQDHEELRRIAYERRIPIAEQIRLAVKAYLAKGLTGKRSARATARKPKPKVRKGGGV